MSNSTPIQVRIDRTESKIQRFNEKRQSLTGKKRAKLTRAMMYLVGHKRHLMKLQAWGVAQ